MKTYDAVVIGGGPAGITAALYLLRSGLSVARVEQLSHGGQMLLTEAVNNYPGFPRGIAGYELADLFEAHLEDYSLARYADAALTLEHYAPGDNRILAGEEWIQAKSVIICSGAKHKNLGLLREQEMLGRGISYCALCDGNFFRNQVVAVVGGGNAALEESLYLARLVDKLYLIHRRDRFRGDKIYQSKVIAQPKIEILYDTQVRELLGEDQLTGIRVADRRDGAERDIFLQGLFIFVGFQPQGDFFPKELILSQDGFIPTDMEMRTNLPGIFAAGDIRSKLCRQISTAVGEGATAANAAFLFLEELHG
jgi:thioredoxin reductase (NADPH)